MPLLNAKFNIFKFSSPADYVQNYPKIFVKIDSEVTKFPLHE